MNCNLWIQRLEGKYSGYTFAAIISALSLSLVSSKFLEAQEVSQLDRTQTRQALHAISTTHATSTDPYDHQQNAPAGAKTGAGTQDPNTPVAQPDSNTVSPVDQSQLPATAIPAGGEKEPAKDGKEPQKKEFAALVGSSHKPLFYDNDFAYVCDPEYDLFWFGDNFKRQSLFGIGQLDMGG